MNGYSMICTKYGYKPAYFPLSHMVDNDIRKLMFKMEGLGYQVELIKD